MRFLPPPPSSPQRRKPGYAALLHIRGNYFRPYLSIPRVPERCSISMKILLLAGDTRKKKGGVKAVLDWLEGWGANCFSTINRGVMIFWVLQGVLSVLLQMGLLLRNKLTSKMQVVKMDNPVRRILSKTSLL